MSRTVTRIGSGSAAAAALAQVSGIQSEVRTGSVVASALPTAQVIDCILGLPIPDLREHLEKATSDELRIIHAYMGLGKAGTTEANKLLICEQVEQRRNVLASYLNPFLLADDSFANEPLRHLPSIPDMQISTNCMLTIHGRRHRGSQNQVIQVGRLNWKCANDKWKSFCIGAAMPWRHWWFQSPQLQHRLRMIILLWSWRS